MDFAFAAILSSCQQNVLSVNWFVSETSSYTKYGIPLLVPCDILCGTCSWPKWRRRNPWWWKRTAWRRYLLRPAPTPRSWSSPAGRLRTDRPHTPALAK